MCSISFTNLKHSQNKMNMEVSKAEKPIRERKLALLQEVDKLKRKLRHEENVHRALKRAFSRPLGALPRLPPYLPPYILRLLAEVAVLEEEVVRLEEQVVIFSQVYCGEYTINLQSRTEASSPDLMEQFLVPTLKQEKLKSFSQGVMNSGSSRLQHLISIPRSGARRKLFPS